MSTLPKTLADAERKFSSLLVGDGTDFKCIEWTGPFVRQKNNASLGPLVPIFNSKHFKEIGYSAVPVRHLYFRGRGAQPPHDQFMRNLCGNRKCVNPDHFKLEVSEEVLFNSIAIDQDGGCWTWLGALDKDGYGKFSKKYQRAHRAVFEAINNKSLDDNILCCHTCDNTSCCNPRHIFEGAVQDNHVDMVKKGRDRGPFKLTKAQANEVRGLLGKVPLKVIAEKFGVSVGPIFYIKHGMANEEKRPEVL